ncbi:MAG: peptidase M14 [Myxococcales bacterium]|nr:peptidase M14 [Myxococcales bacterium]
MSTPTQSPASPPDPSTDYLDYAALTAYVKHLAETHPRVVRVHSIGISPQGRELWLLTVGVDPERRRPSVWIDGNMHACELAGSSVALALAARLATMLDGGGIAGGGEAATASVPPTVIAAASAPLYYILPRMSPDGAEAVLKTGRFVRSLPRDPRAAHTPPRWLYQDLDGDGLALAMRILDPAGDFVEAPGCPGLLVQRGIADPGPYYKLYPEGIIEHFDGHSVPAFTFMDDNPIDLNRNFPAGWVPHHRQVGAGAFATSEPESRAVVEFAVAHPEIFMWFNFHCFGGVFIRPLGDGPDSKLNQSDLAVFRQLGAWAEEFTKYPMVSGYDEFLYEPDKPLHGDLSDFAFETRGAYAFAIELWDLFARLGMKRPKRFVEYYEQMTRAEVIALYRWDREHNGGRAFPAWRACQHPQLGAVEVGGIDPRHTVWNPPPAQLTEMCGQHFTMLLHAAALTPTLQLSPGPIERTGELVRVTCIVRNLGYLPTHVLHGAKALDIAQPLAVDFSVTHGTLVDPGAAHQVIGHLAGWGHGLDGAANLPAYMQSEGNATQTRVAVWLRGAGAAGKTKVRIRAGGLRTGWVEATLEV